MRQQTCFQPAQKPPNCPERSTAKLIIDYSPGPDAVSRVMRKRTVPAAAEEVNRTRSGPPECPNQQPDFSASRRQFGLAVQPESIFGTKQRTCQASGGGPCSAQHGDEFDQRASNRLQPSDHRCQRVVPGQICQPKPRPSRPAPCFIPDLQSLVYQQQLLEGSQAQGIKMKPPCKKTRPTKRCLSVGAEPASFRKLFPSFMDKNTVGKKKNNRVSFAEEVDVPNCSIYSQCGGSEQPSGPQNKKRANQRQAELRNVPCVSDMDPMAYQAPCPPYKVAKPTCSQQQRQPQRKAQQKRHDENRLCIGMYQEQQRPDDIMEQCKHQRKTNLPCRKPQEHQEESNECSDDADSSENKKYLFTSTCGEVQQPVEDCSDDSDQPNELARPTCKHVKEEDFRGNSVEFEANQDDEDDEDDEEESPEQPQATRRSTSKKVSLGRSSAVKTHDPCIKITGSTSERCKTRQSELRDRPRRDSDDYTVQAGAQDRRSSTIDDQRGQSKAESFRRSSIGQKQTRKASSKMPDEQPADVASKTSTSACRDRRERPICPQPTKPPCKDEQQSRKLRQRASSEPCTQIYQQTEQRQKGSGNLKCQKNSKPSAEAATATPAVATPAVPETCKKALQEDAEHWCRQEKAEKAKEAALKAALQGRRSSKGPPPGKPAENPQPAPAPQTETTKLCHCSLHSDLSCDAPLDQLSQRIPKSKAEKQKTEPRRASAQSERVSDNSKFTREGHLLVRLDDSGRPTNSKVMSRGQRPCDIYSFCSEHQQGDCGDEKVADDEDQCEEAEDAPEPPPPPPPEPEETSIPEDPPVAENPTSGATTEDTGEPVILKKKCCC